MNRQAGLIHFDFKAVISARAECGPALWFIGVALWSLAPKE
jgi:hypothetical protein